MGASLPVEFSAALSARFGDDFFTTDARELAHYGVDATRVWQPDPSAVAFPRTTEELAALVKLCVHHGVAMVPSGGRTGLAGGAVAMSGELVVSMEKMNHIGVVDLVGMTVRVGAGAVTQAVHDAVAEHGLLWPVDLAAKGSSQIGGNIATNAGGVRVVRYGHTRHWVLGLRVVTPTGGILELGGRLEKNNTGLDLRQLFIGTEGTLGFIAEAELKLTTLPGEHRVVVLGMQSLDSVMNVYGAARRGPFTLSAFEFFTDKCSRRVALHLGVEPPLGEKCPCYALLECEGASDTIEEWLGDIAEPLGIVDGTVSNSAAQAEELWVLREGISESLSKTGFPHKNDISIPVADVARFCDELESLLADKYPGWEVCLFGHVGDGNIHVNVMKPDELTVEEFLERTHEADRDIFALVRDYAGSISAEHGVGLLKKSFLDYSRTPEELAVFRAVKVALDPSGLMNPGKILD